MADILLFLIAAVLHECGHIIMAGVLGVKLVTLRLRGIGAVMQFDFSSCCYLCEAAVHFAGALMNILSSCLAVIMWGSSAYYFCGISLTLAFVNLLPIRGFDGGGIVCCTIARFLMPDIAWRICSILSLIGIITLWTAVLWIELRCGGNLTLIIFALCIIIGQLK